MKAFGSLCVIFVALLVLPLYAEAGEIAGKETIAKLRGIFTQQDWIVYSSGLTAGLTALGGTCVHPASVGEIAGYLQYTAIDLKTVAQAIKDDLDRRGCRIGQGTEAKAAWFNPLVHARTTVDVGYLRTLVQFSGEDEVGAFMRVLATDRLRELDQMPRVPLPRQ